MTLHIDYITDLKGKNKSVVIPYKEWEEFTKEHDMLKSKISVLTELDKSLKEKKEGSSDKVNGKKNGKSLEEKYAHLPIRWGKGKPKIEDFAGFFGKKKITLEEIRKSAWERKYYCTT